MGCNPSTTTQLDVAVPDGTRRPTSSKGSAKLDSAAIAPVAAVAAACSPPRSLWQPEQFVSNLAHRCCSIDDPLDSNNNSLSYSNNNGSVLDQNNHNSESNGKRLLKLTPWTGKRVAMMFCDASGFSKMSAALKHRGAAAIADATNSYFARLLSCISEHQLDVVAMIGDAILCVAIDPEEEEGDADHVAGGGGSGGGGAAMAFRCACELQRSHSRHVVDVSRAGDAPKFAEMRLHIGVAYGELTAEVAAPMATVDGFIDSTNRSNGNIMPQCFFWTFGRVQISASNATASAPTGTIAVCATVIEAMTTSCPALASALPATAVKKTTPEDDEPFFLLSEQAEYAAVVAAVPLIIINSSSSSSDKSSRNIVPLPSLAGNPLSKVAAVAASQQQRHDHHHHPPRHLVPRNRVVDELFIPPLLKQRLDAGLRIEDACELRNTVVFFIKKLSSNGTKAAWFRAIVSVFASTVAGSVDKFVVDEKATEGLVVCTLNLYKSAPNPSDTALAVCRQILQLVPDSAIGVARGGVYSGLTGKAGLVCRADITGDVVVRACRLMSFVCDKFSLEATFAAQQHNNNSNQSDQEQAAAVRNGRRKSVATIQREAVRVAIDASVQETLLDKSLVETLDPEVTLKGTAQPIAVYTLTHIKDIYGVGSICCVNNHTFDIEIHQRLRAELWKLVVTSPSARVSAALLTGTQFSGKKTLVHSVVADALQFTPILHRCHGSKSLASTLATFLRFHEDEELAAHAAACLSADASFNQRDSASAVEQMLKRALQIDFSIAIILDHAEYLDKNSSKLLRNALLSSAQWSSTITTTKANKSTDVAASSHRSNKASSSIFFFLTYSPLYHGVTVQHIRGLGEGTQCGLIPVIHCGKIESFEEARVLGDGYLAWKGLHGESLARAYADMGRRVVGLTLFAGGHIILANLEANVSGDGETGALFSPVFDDRTGHAHLELTDRGRDTVHRTTYRDIANFNPVQTTILPAFDPAIDALPPHLLVVCKTVSAIQHRFEERCPVEVVLETASAAMMGSSAAMTSAAAAESYASGEKSKIVSMSSIAQLEELGLLELDPVSHNVMFLLPPCSEQVFDRTVPSLLQYISKRAADLMSPSATTQADYIQIARLRTQAQQPQLALAALGSAWRVALAEVNAHGGDAAELLRTFSHRIALQCAKHQVDVNAVLAAAAEEGDSKLIAPQLIAQFRPAPSDCFLGRYFINFYVYPPHVLGPIRATLLSIRHKTVMPALTLAKKHQPCPRLSYLGSDIQRYGSMLRRFEQFVPREGATAENNREWVAVLDQKLAEEVKKKQQQASAANVFGPSGDDGQITIEEEIRRIQTVLDLTAEACKFERVNSEAAIRLAEALLSFNEIIPEVHVPRSNRLLAFMRKTDEAPSPSHVVSSSASSSSSSSSAVTSVFTPLQKRGLLRAFDAVKDIGMNDEKEQQSRDNDEHPMQPLARDRSTLFSAAANASLLASQQQLTLSATDDVEKVHEALMFLAASNFRLPFQYMSVTQLAEFFHGGEMSPLHVKAWLWMILLLEDLLPPQLAPQEMSVLAE